MRSLVLAAFVLMTPAAIAAGQTTTTRQTSPFPGPATPQTPAAPAPANPPQSVVSPPSSSRVFASEAGMIFNAVRPDKVADFETVIAKLRQALAMSADPVRQQQARGWKILKATEPGPNGSVLYVFVMDPAVKGADYGVAKILADAYPMEIQELYRMYNGAFATAGQTLLNLQAVPAPSLAKP